MLCVERSGLMGAGCACGVAGEEEGDDELIFDASSMTADQVRSFSLYYHADSRTCEESADV